MTAAVAQSFLEGSHLPSRWHRCRRFVVLDTELGDAARFLACWRAWRIDRPWRLAEAGRQAGGSAAAGQLHVIAIASRLPGADEMRATWSRSVDHDAASPSAAVAMPPTGGPSGAPPSTLSTMVDELLADWPPAVPGLHRLAFDGGEVQLLLAVGGGGRHWLGQLAARVDAFFIDGNTLVGDTDRSWPLRLFKAAGRLAAPGATLVLPAADDAAHAALRAAGFVPSSAGGVADGPRAAGNDADAGRLWCGRYAPAFTPRRPSNRLPAEDGPPPRRPQFSFRPPELPEPPDAPPPRPFPAPERHALIIGAGLAGCAAAWALAELGWHSTLLDRHAAPALEASGNPGGLFHGTVHRQDGAHARFNRAAALEARRAVHTAITRHGVAGGASGLLRVEPGGFAAPPGMPSVQDGGGPESLTADYARIVDAEEATALAGIPIAHPCWFYPGGGWVQPAGLARAFIERGGARVRFVGGVSVASLRRRERPAAGAGREEPAAMSDGCWQLIDAAGRVLGESAVVVLAHAGDAYKMLADTATPPVRPASNPADTTATAPLQTVRGQLSMLPVADLAQALPGLLLPRLPIVGSGWLLPAVDGLAVFGATAQTDDGDPAVRASDHAANLAALGRLTGLHFANEPPPSLQGRTAWRCVAMDRLPLIGAVPQRDQPGCGERPRRADRIGDIPREPGLYTFSALGSRGITWAALGAQVLASLIAGAPVPVSRGLIEAVDPGRFWLRRQRRRPRR